MTPFMKEIIPPDEGWKPQSYYKVLISFSDTNPIHVAVLYTGFLNDHGEPGSYHKIWNPIYGRQYALHDVYYLKAVCKFDMDHDL